MYGAQPDRGFTVGKGIRLAYVATEGSGFGRVPSGRHGCMVKVLPKGRLTAIFGATYTAHVDQPAAYIHASVNSWAKCWRNECSNHDVIPSGEPTFTVPRYARTEPRRAAAEKLPDWRFPVRTESSLASARRTPGGIPVRTRRQHWSSGPST